MVTHKSQVPSLDTIPMREVTLATNLHLGHSLAAGDDGCHVLLSSIGLSRFSTYIQIRTGLQDLDQTSQWLIPTRSTL